MRRSSTPSLVFSHPLFGLGLVAMTFVIQVFVFPGAYATHCSWAALLLYVMARGPGAFSIDQLLAKRQAVRHKRKPT